MCNRVLWQGDELTQTSLRNICYPAGELKATFSIGLEVLQCSRTLMSSDRSPVTRGRSVAEYPLHHGQYH